MAPRLPVTIVGGYLGAGKTTLLNGLLRGTHGLRLAVIVNDFGSVNIDAALIANRQGETISLANGCICCSIATELPLALHALAERNDGPEHIVIEASGVADLRRLAHLGASHPRLALDCIATVADAETVRTLAADRYVGDLVLDQLRAADLVVLSKTDLIDAEAQRGARDWLAAAVPGVRILPGNDAGLFAAAVLAGGRAPPGQEHTHEHTHEHAEPFATRTLAADRPLDGVRLRAALAAAPASLIRAKGFVALAESPGETFLLQLVGRRWSLAPQPQSPVPPGRSLVVCIGLAGEPGPDRLAALFTESAA